jgi:hypothetical protein
VVIYQPTLDKLEAVLVSGDCSLDPETSHGIAYQRILSACAEFESLPGFFSSDSQEFGSLDIASKAPQSMHTAKEVSIEGRRQVLEDRDDVCDSESDSENEEHGDELSLVYKNVPLDDKGNPISGTCKPTSEQANVLRTGMRCSKEFKGSSIQPR